MESQESDLCGQDELEHMEHMIGDPLNEFINTMDWSGVAVPDPVADSPTGEQPARTDFTGTHFFEAKVDMTGNQKKHYVLSTKLNKVFVDLGKVVPFQIKWDGAAHLYVRALMVFAAPDQWKLPVKRCVTHREKDDPTNARYAHNEHVLAMENEGAEYLLDPSSKRYSVKVPLHLQSGCEYSLISLKFMCKTSCTGGLNRAPTDIIFTLEDAQGAVLGRQVIGVKICSCPKRDKEKDEQNFGEPSTGKRKIKVKREEKTTVEEPPLKKVKQEVPTEPGSCSFMVHAINPEVASTLKAHLHQWNGIKMWEYAEPGVIPTPVIEVVDTIAVLPHPYN